MDIARCLLDHVNYYANRFSELPPDEIEEKRYHLICPECQAPAFFRKASALGQAACFGARPHVPGCTMAAPVALRIEDGAGGFEDRIHNPGQRIIVDLAFGAAQPVNANEANDGGQGGRGARRYVGNGPRPDADAHRRLRPLLRTLIEAPDFATSHVEIDVPGCQPLPAHTFFVKFEDLNGAHMGEVRGLWGMVASARLTQDGIWLNSGGRASLSVLLPNDMVDAALGRYRVDDLEQLAGAYLLVIGRARWSQNGKQFCVPDTAQHIALILT